jgi:monofunctional biosynthetic peptidoglycan transglycosylase
MRDFGGKLSRPPLRRDFARRVFITAAASFAGFVALCLIFVGLYAVVPIPMTPLVGIRAVEAGFSGRPVRFAKDWVSIEEMAPSLLKAAIASEDFHFTEHRGFDFDAIEKAMKANERTEIRGRGRIRGASTISQQTAKNVFLWPGRTWLRKGLEAWMTVLIEATWSKRRILEVYLNVIEFGDGVYGVEAASHRFFHKSAKQLSPSEAALLIAVLPNPRKLLVDRPSAYVRYRQTSILRRLSYVDVPE